MVSGFVLALAPWILMPFALIIRPLGRDPMHRLLKTKTGSYWTPINWDAHSETFLDLFCYKKEKENELR